MHVIDQNIKLDGTNPTLLYGYGGFNINLMPNYGALATFFISKLNGVYAYVNLRGGGYFTLYVGRSPC